MEKALQSGTNYVIAIYIRLSTEDGDLSNEKNESNSVGNQREFIHQYIVQKGKRVEPGNASGSDRENLCK